MISAVEELVEELAGLPSIGRKSAWRLALHLLERRSEDVFRLADTIRSVKERVLTCSRCGNYGETDPCKVCSDTKRDSSVICVVEKPVDVFSMESHGRFRGLYHVLGGVLSPINGITPDKLRIADLVDRATREKPSEIIIAVGGSAEAETTAHYITRVLENTGVKLTRLARGLPAGASLEYVDPVTLVQALNERTGISYGHHG